MEAWGGLSVGGKCMKDCAFNHDCHQTDCQHGACAQDCLSLETCLGSTLLWSQIGISFDVATLTMLSLSCVVWVPVWVPVLLLSSVSLLSLKSGNVINTCAHARSGEDSFQSPRLPRGDVRC